MSETICSFYDPLAEHYHLIFDDWDRAIARQAQILAPLLQSEISAGPLKILDCACGIGTQAIGLAQRGHHLVGSDLSPSMIGRARREATLRSLDIAFHTADMTSLRGVGSGFDAAVALDNALPHLDAHQLTQAAQTIASRLIPGGLFLASIRDYDRLTLERPAIQTPAFYGDAGDRRIVHQVWDWIDDTRYTVHLHIALESQGTWQSHHFVSEYRCLLREELSVALTSAGFTGIRWLMPSESGFYQPLVVARHAGEALLES